VDPTQALSPELWTWLEQRGLGFAVGAVWIWTLLRDRTTLQRQNEKLSESLCRTIESGSSERARMADEYRLAHDWTVRSLLDHFTALATRRESLAPRSLSPKQRQPTNTAASEPTPPPLPPVPPLPTGPKRRAT
jgi:hypothetical protein